MVSNPSKHYYSPSKNHAKVIGENRKGRFKTTNYSNCLTINVGYFPLLNTIVPYKQQCFVYLQTCSHCPVSMSSAPRECLTVMRHVGLVKVSSIKRNSDSRNHSQSTDKIGCPGRYHIPCNNFQPMERGRTCTDLDPGSAW